MKDRAGAGLPALGAAIVLILSLGGNLVVHTRGQPFEGLQKNDEFRRTSPVVVHVIGEGGRRLRHGHRRRRAAVASATSSEVDNNEHQKRRERTIARALDHLLFPAAASSGGGASRGVAGGNIDDTERGLGGGGIIDGGRNRIHGVAPSRGEEESAPEAGREDRQGADVMEAQKSSPAAPAVDYVPKDVVLSGRYENDRRDHVRFERTYNGLRVVGGDLVVHMDAASGKYLGTSQTLTVDKGAGGGDDDPLAALGSGPPLVSPEEAARAAVARHGGAVLAAEDTTSIAPLASDDKGSLRRLSGGRGRQGGDGDGTGPVAELVVYAAGHDTDPSSSQKTTRPTLAWAVRVRGDAPDGTPTTLRVYLDTTTGDELGPAVSETKTLLPVGGDRLLDVPSPAAASRGRADDRRHLSRDGGGDSSGRATPRDATAEKQNRRRLTPSTGVGRTDFVGEVDVGTSRVDGAGASNSDEYHLLDTTRGGQHTTDMLNTENPYLEGKTFARPTNVWGNFDPSDRTTHAADAHFAQQATWDYFQNVHGRDGVYDTGVGSYSRVHFGTDYVNAFWWSGPGTCNCMTYGDGDNKISKALVSLDVGGHEMAHGVTSSTADLIYAGESGGLNEATSDIFATMVEYYVNSTKDKPDYLIGEEVWLVAPYYLRSMINPSVDGHSVDCWHPAVKDMDVHHSSGVGNHFFYLLAEGTTNGVPSRTCTPGDTNGVATGLGTVEGIGRNKAERIWYVALTAYMTSDTNYHDAARATEEAAAQMFGYPSPEVGAVKEAWRAVGIVAEFEMPPPVPPPATPPPSLPPSPPPTPPTPPSNPDPDPSPGGTSSKGTKGSKQGKRSKSTGSNSKNSKQAKNTKNRRNRSRLHVERVVR